MSAVPTIAVNGLFLTQPITGVQRYAREICAAVVRAAGGRMRFALLVPGQPGRGDPSGSTVGELAALPGLEIIRSDTRLPSAAWVQAQLPLLVRSLGADLLWSPSNVGPLFTRRHLVTIFDASVFAFPDGFSRAFRAYYRWLLPRLGRKALAIVTISDFSRGELIRWGMAPASRIHVVPCGVSKAFRPDAGPGRWRHKQPYLLTVGSRDARKNVRGLVQAWEALPAGVREGRRLLIAGGGGKVFAAEPLAPLPQGVELLGRVPDPDLPGLYAGAELFLYPSLYEGFGLPPLEAMASGVPVLASKASSLPEVLDDAAVLCDPADVPGMAQRIQVLLEDGEERARLRRSGLRRALRYTWESAAARMLEVLENALGAISEGDRVR